MGSSTQIQRTSHKIPGFDPYNDAHVLAVEKKISDEAGVGFKVSSFDPDTETVTFERIRTVTEVSSERGSTRLIATLRTDAKPSDGDREAARLEHANPGYTMTQYEPHLGRGVLERLSEDVVRCRSAVANALSVKPWDVQVSARHGGGFELRLPRSYMPSKHDEKLTEVAENVVGAPGWYVDVSPKSLSAQIVPGQPPTFPAAIPYPFDEKVPDRATDREAWAQLPLGRILPERADAASPRFTLDLESGPHTAINGVSGAGKTVTINAAIFGALSRGMQLAIVDVPAKKVDFLWAKKFCAPGFWGCDSLEASVTTMGLIYDEGQRRSEILERHGVVKAAELPASEQFPPIFVVVDELTGLLLPEEVPKISKDDPIRIEAEQTNSNKARLKRFIKKTAAELRFVDMKLLLSTQVASQNTGITPDLRTNLQNKILLGAKPTDSNRRLALNDPTMVPRIPGNVANDRRARLGVGVFETEAEPGVFKSYYADFREYEKRLTALGATTCDSPAPSKSQIAQYTGGESFEDAIQQLPDDDPWNRRRVPKAASDRVYSEDGTELRGAAAAARAGRQAST
ncbi:cell division protein FtsK [Brachybacterium sp. ACRRE]|uniref:cell division protein FtsK n=1 Tax=Brachybacterium sp. ACRRE TaxID=2918184 RepID=UPI001EF1E6B1|nr:cell division protein FtsK [Brachybacterium sp. ACRRE]MCG7309685.1 cell division protein FtsK [Brachybacterium sp. ACRRE]